MPLAFATAFTHCYVGITLTAEYPWLEVVPYRVSGTVTR